MLSFVNDYSQGAHEAILNRLLQINPETIARGYGADHYCESAKEKSAWSLPHCWTLMRGV